VRIFGRRAAEALAGVRDVVVVLGEVRVQADAIGARECGDSRMKSRDTENGEHGAARDAQHGQRDGSWNASITRRVSRRIVVLALAPARPGGRPPADSPTLIAPRHAWKRRPISRAAAIVSSSGCRSDTGRGDRSTSCSRTASSSASAGLRRHDIISGVSRCHIGIQRAQPGEEVGVLRAGTARVSVWKKWWCVLTRPAGRPGRGQSIDLVGRAGQARRGGSHGRD
jgi:hypothetical protein